ncbi:MAG: hypothetical protein JWM20_946 [Patescibacteria group bacterium]|nr:hypothetical protein [Patescibacteria group bacterium]
MNALSRLTKTKYFFAGMIVAAIAGYSLLVYAAAPSGGYAPGATLNPDCGPNDTDCAVNLPTGGGVAAFRQ